jgi:aldehyde:ferredoxin oxidoreductase
MVYTVLNLWSAVSWAPKLPPKFPRKEQYEVNEANAKKAMANSCIKMVLDGAGGCWFAISLGIQHWRLFDCLNAATGWDMTPDEYMETGKRIQTLRQMFNVKHGIDPKSYKITERMRGNPPLEKGPLAGITVDTEKMMQQYWAVFGWDPTSGIPTDDTVKELRLPEL